MAFVGPEDAGLAEALPPLMDLMGCVVALGLVRAGKGLVDYTRWAVGSSLVGEIPGASWLLDKTVQTPLQELSNAMGSWEQGLDHEIGVSFHRLAQVVEMLARFVERAYHDDQGLGIWLRGVADNVASGHAEADLVRDVAEAADSIGHHAVSYAATVDEELHGIDETLRDRLDGVEKTLRDAVAGSIGAIEREVGDLKQQAGDAWELLRRHEKALGRAGITAGVGVALGELGGSWIRCDSNQALGKAHCGLPKNLLSDLLAAVAVVAAGTFGLEETAKWGQTIIVKATPKIAGFWGAVLSGPGGNPAVGATGFVGGLEVHPPAAAANPAVGQSGA